MDTCDIAHNERQAHFAEKAEKAIEARLAAIEARLDALEKFVATVGLPADTRQDFTHCIGDNL